MVSVTPLTDCSSELPLHRRHATSQPKTNALHRNYAKSHPDLCILAVNTFVQDSEDPNPLIRALAIRTMGCIRVDKMVDYMEEPLRKTLRDESPYVRKTAAICVAKLFDLNPTMCIENGFLETLQEMIGDSNPMVVANSVQALSEISETAPETAALVITPPTLKKLLMALNECTEWGRVTILSTLAAYPPTDVKESEHICERVAPQFQHVNPSVVLAAVKVVFIHMKLINADLVRQYLKKMAPPLVTLIASAPEVQYVALRNIDLLLQAKPDILSNQLRVFFCKYNDPAYLKLQKLEIMVRIANEKNFEQLLGELKEYALEVDMDFVRRAVKAIGQVAIKIEGASEKCVNALLDLIATKVNYVVQEVVVVIKDILRKYPGYEGVIPTLCQYIDELDEPNARGSLIWIVGEYAEKISNADEILASFVDVFSEEFTQTQLQILTAVVKLFLKKPQSSQGLVQKVLQAATTDNDNPDIRDRAYVYWRLLSGDLDVAKVSTAEFHGPISSLTDFTEHYPIAKARHLYDYDFPASSSTRTALGRAVYSCIGIPQATRVLCRKRPLWRGRYPACSYSGAARKSRRKPERRICCRSCPGQRLDTTKQHREPP